MDKFQTAYLNCLSNDTKESINYESIEYLLDELIEHIRFIISCLTDQQQKIFKITNWYDLICLDEQTNTFQLSLKGFNISFQATLQKIQNFDLRFYCGSISNPDKNHIVYISFKPIKIKKPKQKVVQKQELPIMDEGQKMLLDYIWYFRNK